LTVAFCEEFSIPSELIGLAIGSHGANMQAAREIDDITDVIFDPSTNMFKVC